MTRDGTSDVVVGRADGRVEVYCFDEAGTGPPSKHFEASVGESVHSVECGSLSNPAFDEVVCCTFSGRIVSFSKEPLAETRDAEDAKGRSLAATSVEHRERALEADVADLRTKVDIERSRLRGLETDRQRRAKKASSSSSSSSSKEAPAPARTFSRPSAFRPQVTMTLDPSAACYVVTIELPVPIDLVTLKASVRVELLDVDHNTSIVSRSPVEARHESPKEKIALVASFRCQEGTNALTFKMRTVEGEPGEILAVVVAKTCAPKSAQVVRLTVKALSLHRRVHEGETSTEADRPRNVLRLTGNFSAKMIHDWLARCLPEVPPRPAAALPLLQSQRERDAAAAADGNDDQGGGGEGGGDDAPVSSLSEEERMAHRLCFRNVYTSGVLECDYGEGEARICSDSISAMAILKEHLSREAVRLRVDVQDRVEIREATVAHFLGLLDGKLRHQLKLAHDVKLIDSINEICAGGGGGNPEDDGTSWLSDEYVAIRARATEIREEFKESPTELLYMTGIVTDFFVDRLKFAGLDGRHKIPALANLLANYDQANLLQFFDPNLHRH